MDFLTADGELEVELEIDHDVRLAPDEQIEVFRIVQEGLANTRKHAHARRAWVTIGQRGAERLVVIRDDGSGFEPPVDSAAQGLTNMRQRAAAIGGAFTLGTAPGGAPRSRSCSVPRVDWRRSAAEQAQLIALPLAQAKPPAVANEPSVERLDEADESDVPADRHLRA